MERIEVAPDGWTFRGAESHRRFVPFGTNAVIVRPNVKTQATSYFIMFEREWHADLFAKFADHAASLGMNVIKFFMPLAVALPDPQPDDHAAASERALDIMEEALDIANARGVYLMPTSSEWHGSSLTWWRQGGEYVGRLPGDPAGPDSLAIITDWWRAAAARLRGRPGVFAYNLAVEWLMPNGNMTPPSKGEGLSVLSHPGADAAWRHWLRLRYGTPAELRRSWRNDVRRFEDAVTPTCRFADGQYVAGEQVVYDYAEFREWTCYRYLKAQADAIRAVDDGHMVTCGLDPRKPYGLGEHADERGGAALFGGFVPTELDFLDFIPMHEYTVEGKDEGYRPLPGEGGERMLRAAVNHLRFCYCGKPVILEEFGHLNCPDLERGARLCEELVRASASGCGGWLVWNLTQPDNDDPAVGPGAFLIDGDDPLNSPWRLTPWGRRLKDLAAPGGFVDSLPPARPAAKQVVEFDRRKELAPYGSTSCKHLIDHWDEYDHPLDFVWPRNPHLRL